MRLRRADAHAGSRSRRYFPSHPRRGCAHVSPTGEMMRNFFAFLLRQLRAMEESPLSRERVNSKRRDYIEARLRLGAAAGLRLRSCCSVRATCCGECCRRPPSVDDSRCDAFTASGRCIRIWIQPRRFVLHWMAGVAQLIDDFCVSLLLSPVAAEVSRCVATSRDLCHS